VTRRAIWASSLFVLILVSAPFFADRYLLSVLITALWFAYLSQAWNIMLGFAGLLSLGHALYVGLGAYVSAALYVHFGIGPWLGVWAAIAAASGAGAAIAFLGFRFGVRGVHFALLTIAFAEVARVAFDHIPALGGSAGLFLPTGGPPSWPDLRVSPVVFYYLILALTIAAAVATRIILHSRMGYRWLAVREDVDAAEASGVNTLSTRVVAVAVSAGMTAVGGVFQAFYLNSLFPEQAFAMSRSIEIILPSIVGGVGTVFGPILGAFILTPLGEILTWAVEAAGVSVPGLKLMFYGMAIVAIIIFRSEGVWPGMAARLGVRGRPGEDAS